MIALTMDLSNHADHAVNVHADPVASHVFDMDKDKGTTVGACYDRLTQWVTDTLTDDSDPDAFLASVLILPTDTDPDGISRPTDVA
jgi:hypothetical protein